MICYDEFGPLEIRPHAGASWHPVGQPNRLPATYTRLKGTRYLLAAYDLQGDRLWGWQRPNQRWQQVLAFFKAIRKRYPRSVRLYIILDNRRSHKKAEVLSWAKENRVTLVFTPTYASWLNRIESHFESLKRFALRGRTFIDHKEQGQAIQAYLRWRNKHHLKGSNHPKEQRVNRF